MKNSAISDENEALHEPPPLSSNPLTRLLFTIVGLLMTGLGIIGAFLPVMPTTVFLLVAVWCFSKSSERLHRWLWTHKHLGRSLRRWQECRCIPKSTKAVAVTSMTASSLYLIFFSELGWPLLVPSLAFIAFGAAFVLRAPSEPMRCRMS